MKVPVRKVSLKDLDEEYGEYYVLLPRSLPEGWYHQIAERNLEAERIGQKYLAESDDEKKEALRKEEAVYRRESNAMVLDVVTEWNLDDDDGNVLPVPRSVRDPKKKVAVLSSLPTEVIELIALQIWNPKKPAVLQPEVQDFSNGS